MNFVRVHDTMVIVRRICLWIWALSVLGVSAADNRPTIVVFLADDLGTGDVSALSMGCRIRTPYLDGFASESTRLTDFHTNSSVCSPTRYGLLTGRYAWRTHLQSFVLNGDSKPLIPSTRPTIASALKASGYRTVCIGKWHLGLNWTMDAKGKPDYSSPFSGGPLDVGFETFYGVAASADMPPYVMIEGNQSVVAPVDKFGDAIYPKRIGPAAPGWKAEELLETVTVRAIAELRKCREDARPLFLYIPLPSPHTPIAPSEKWKGRSGINAYADFVMETDNSIGRILMALRESGRSENSLVVFTADNGCSPAANFTELKAAGHDSSAGFRGAKADLYEGGHRVPCIVRWPGRIARQGSSDALSGMTDLFATCLAAAGVEQPPVGGEDSVNLLPVLFGRVKSVRESYIMHSINGFFSIRKGAMKYLACRGSGGWSQPNAKADDYLRLPIEQLYDLEQDPREQANLVRQRPEAVVKLRAELDAQILAGRTTPGPESKNDVPVKVEKE
jgi:arylsulfatase A-like enzyme